MSNLLQHLTIHNSQPVRLSGKQNLSTKDIISVALGNTPVQIDLNPEVEQRLNTVHHKIIDQVKQGTPIYGVTAPELLTMESKKNAFTTPRPFLKPSCTSMFLLANLYHLMLSKPLCLFDSICFFRATAVPANRPLKNYHNLSTVVLLQLSADTVPSGPQEI